MAVIPTLVIRIRSPAYVDKLVVWAQTWGEFLPPKAREEFVVLMREALKAETLPRA